MSRKSRTWGMVLKTGNQIAALPMQWSPSGEFQILMVTSRDTGRWVIPKGWLMDGKTPWAAAEIEALEESGALGCIGREMIGKYRYNKKLNNGSSLRCKVCLYPMIVDRLKSDWKERAQRKRKWFSATGAAKRVAEPELAELFQTLATKPAKQPVIKRFLKASSWSPSQQRRHGQRNDLEALLN